MWPSREAYAADREIRMFATLDYQGSSTVTAIAIQNISKLSNKGSLNKIGEGTPAIGERKVSVLVVGLTVPVGGLNVICVL